MSKMMTLSMPIWSVLVLSLGIVAGCDSRREVSSEIARNEHAAGASRVPAASDLKPGLSERPVPDSPPVPPGEPAGSAEPGLEASDSTPEGSGSTRHTTGRDVRDEVTGFTGVEMVPDTAQEPDTGPGEDDFGIPLAPMGYKKSRTALAGAPGYVPPDDPEAGSMEHGRRDVPRRGVAFSEGAPSSEDLARAILAALRTREPSELHRLRVTKQEFSEILWPEMPQSRPITNTRAEDAWFFVEADNRAGVNSGMGDWGGQDLELVRVRYGTGRAPYTNYTLYRGVRIVARPPGGEEVTLGFVEAFAECGGVWKVYSFKD